jgi:hypothetical protein
LGGVAVGWATFGPYESKRSLGVGMGVAGVVIALAGIGSMWISGS